MIVEEYSEDRTRVIHYSDEGFYILQHPTEIKYESARDVVPCKYTYTETDEKIPDEPEPPVPTEEE